MANVALLKGQLALSEYLVSVTRYATYSILQLLSSLRICASKSIRARKKCRNLTLLHFAAAKVVPIKKEENFQLFLL